LELDRRWQAEVAGLVESAEKLNHSEVSGGVS
jgi:hypothetical protein